MASNESNKRCIMAIPMTSILIEHGDDFTANGESQFTASGLQAVYNDLKATVKGKSYSGSTVEFGLTNNSFFHVLL
ncbi:MAG: hypothetical protein ACK5N4_11230 [Parabacteroides gordonii]|uniref:hypothetical protein n=1 Tax=Parabacteroides gordonii TaxID=574930 RepID=UPI003A86918A|nr:hypothetical protein [Parabacteroides gordonii]